jgi:hypothetical protein
MESRYFKDYGDLEWIEAEYFYKDGWGIYETSAEADDGELYTIVISSDKTKLCYTAI